MAPSAPPGCIRTAAAAERAFEEALEEAAQEKRARAAAAKIAPDLSVNMPLGSPAHAKASIEQHRASAQQQLALEKAHNMQRALKQLAAEGLSPQKLGENVMALAFEFAGVELATGTADTGHTEDAALPQPPAAHASS